MPLPYIIKQHYKNNQLGYFKTLIKHKLQTYYYTKKYAKVFNGLDSWVMFIGHGRDGSSLVGSIINAHPNITISHELDIINLFQQNYGRDKIFANIIFADTWFREVKKSTWNQYNYVISNTPFKKSKYQNLKIIGDKKGGRTSYHLLKDPTLLTKLEASFAKKIKIIHTIRNPYDSISSWFIDRKQEFVLPADFAQEIHPKIDAFFAQAQSINKVKSLNKFSIFEISHDALIANPQKTIEALFNFLEVSIPPSLLKDCVSRIHTTQNKNRHKLPWTKALTRKVQQQIEKYDFLQRYTFKN